VSTDAPPRSTTRRVSARRTLTLAAAMAVACAHDVHRIGPIAPAATRREPAVRVLVFGDYGHRTLLQNLVTRGMRRAHAARPFDLALQLGDNIYPCGPDPTRAGAETCRFAADGSSVEAGATLPDDPVFRKNEAPLDALRGPDGVPLAQFLVLGNHDVGLRDPRCQPPTMTAAEALRRRACLSVARRTPTWNIPARHYVIDRGPVRIVAIDSNVVVTDYGGFTLEDEIAFVRAATEPCGGAAGRLCFIAGHHPPAAVQSWNAHGSEFAPRMARLLAATEGRARAFFGGHVHALEHLYVDGLDVFISGSTSMGGYMRFKYRAPAHAQLRFATTAWGHAVLEADERGYRVEFFDFQGEALHCCEAGASGPCRPVACR
jgi:hypothetical protein